MLILTLVLQLLTAVFAFVAAVRWYQASSLVTPDFTVIGAYSPQLEQIVPISQWATTSANLNKAAARWSCASAMAAGLSFAVPLAWGLT